MKFLSLTILSLVLLASNAWAKPQSPTPKHQSAIDSVIYYPSVDQNGDSVTLSGKISIPQNRQPKGILLIPHYTISANKSAPSLSDKGEDRYFRDDYIVVMPDYIGYGLTVNRIHPYLDGELTARNTLDLLLYVQPILDSLAALHAQADNSRLPLYLIGFSQGGASAMWTLKLIEEQYAHIHVERCFVGGGPYDVAATYDDANRRNFTYLPIVIPMLVLGTSEAYNLQLKPEDFLSPAMMRAYDQLIRDKQMSITNLFFRMPSHRVSHWMTTQGMDKSQPETKRLYDGLLRSSLVHYPLDNNTIGADSICPQWTPKTPVYVFHSTKDNVVTFHCAAHLQRCFKNVPNMTFDFGNYGNHLKSAMLFFKRVQEQLKNEHD